MNQSHNPHLTNEIKIKSFCHKHLFCNTHKNSPVLCFIPRSDVAVHKHTHTCTTLNKCRKPNVSLLCTQRWHSGAKFYGKKVKLIYSKMFFKNIFFHLSIREKVLRKHNFMHTNNVLFAKNIIITIMIYTQFVF